MTKYLPCPSCREKGEDRSGNNLRVYPDGLGGFCFKCSKYHRLDGDSVIEKRPYQFQSKNEELDLQVIQSYPIAGIPARGISKKTCEKYGVRVSYDEVDGTIDAVYYPYFNHDNELVGYKKRKLPKSFSVISKQVGLFGQQSCKKGAKFLIIVEGEHDVLAVTEMLQEMGKDYNVVSIPNGANEKGKVDSATLREIEWISSHQTVALCLDNDEPGRATAKALADHLASQCKVGIVSLPLKDAGEMLSANRARDFYKALQDARPYRPDSIVEGSSISLESLRKPKEPGIELPYPKLQKMTWGVRKGEITLLTAGSGIGKSTFAMEIGYHLAVNHDQTVATIGLETNMEDVVRGYIAKDNNVPSYTLMFKPDAVPLEQYEASYQKLIASNKMHFFKHWGSIGSEELIRKCYYFAKALNVDFIVLDHISMVVAGAESRDERKDIDVLFEALARFVVETGVGVIAVMHLKRVPGKSFNKGDEVELTDLRGCVDKDTEFLTPSGWKKISEWDGEMVMEVDENLHGRFYIPREHVVLPCNDGLVHIKTNRLDMMLSDEHRILYYSEKDEANLKKITLKDALTIHTKQSTGFRGRIPCIINGVIDHNAPYISEASVRVHVMVSADGWIRNPNTRRCSVRVKKERKKQRARELLSQYTTDWFEFDINGGYTEFTFTAPFLKGYDGWFGWATQNILEWVADESKHWDGEYSTGRVTSVEKNDADFIQFAYTATGHRSPIRIRELESSFGGEYPAQNQYVVNKTDETHASFRKCPNSKVEITRVPSPDGFKYCFVTSTGAWLARRNGKVFVTGNSAGAEQMSFNVWALERNQQGEQKDLVKIRCLKNRLLGFTGEADTLRYDHQTGRLLPLGIEY